MPPDNRKSTRRRKIGERDLRDLFCYLLRSPPVLEVALSRLKADYFDNFSEVAYALLWTVILAVHEKYGDVQRMALERELVVVLDDVTDELLTPSQAKMLQPETGLLKWIYDELDEAHLVVSDGLQLLKDVLLERGVLVPFEIAVGEGCLFADADFSQLVEQFQQSNAAVQGLGVVSNEPVFPSEWRGQNVAGSPVGIGPFDNFMIHGDAPGETYLLIGPTGGGKTTSLIDIAVSRACVFDGTRREDGRAPVVVYMTYEEPLQNIRCRVLARAARVDKTRLEQAQSFDEFTRRGGPLQDYELQMAADAGIPPRDAPGEYDRMLAVSQMVNTHMHIANMDGTQKGYGGIAEIVAELTAFEQVNPDKYVAMVAIDYVGLMLERWMDATNIKRDSMHIYLASSGTELATKVGKRFNCPVWGAHQLAGEATKRSAASKQHGADAAYGKAASNGYVYVFTLGTPDPTSSIRRLDCTKDRRSGRDNQTTLVQLDGRFQRLHDVSHDYRLDSATGRIVSVRVASEFAGETQQATRPRAAHNARVLSFGLGAEMD